MVILGIDPGIATVGYGVIEYKSNRFRPIDYGAITTPPSMVLADRLTHIYAETEVLIKKFMPDAFSVEELFFNTNVKTAISVAHGRGTLLLCAGQNGVPVFEYTPLQVKQAVCGYGRADKAQIQRMVKTLLALPAVPKPDDVADALAVAVCHAHSASFLKLTDKKEARQ